MYRAVQNDIIGHKWDDRLKIDTQAIKKDDLNGF